MTKFLILVLSFSISACFSQNKLIGNRKVTEVDLGDFYYDVHKDSTSISERMRKEVKPKNLDFFIRLSKSEYKAKYYLFTATDLEERAGKILLKTSKYQVDELQKTIYLEALLFVIWFTNFFLKKSFH